MRLRAGTNVTTARKVLLYLIVLSISEVREDVDVLDLEQGNCLAEMMIL